MTTFNPSVVKDAVYDVLAGASALIAAAPGGVHHRKVVLEPGQGVEYPVVVYQVWGEPIHHGTLGSGRSHSSMRFRVVAWAPDDERAVDAAAVQIETALHNAALSVSPYTLMLCRLERSVEGEQDREDGSTHCFAGGVYEVEVAY